VGFSFFIGLSLTSYQGVYTLTYLFIFILALLINQREYIITLLKNRKNFTYILVGITILFILSMPLLSIFIEHNKVVPIARLDYEGAVVKEGVTLTHGSIEKAATHSSPVDFLELVFPVAVRGYFWGWFYPSPWLSLSECFLYIGILPFLLCIAGIFLSKGKYHLNFLFALITIGLLMLGPRGGAFHLLYFLFYPLRFARHMHLFSGFFIFTLFYFVGQGTDFIIDKFIVKLSKR
jgi:hypothetical protein